MSNPHFIDWDIFTGIEYWGSIPSSIATTKSPGRKTRKRRKKRKTRKVVAGIRL